MLKAKVLMISEIIKIWIPPKKHLYENKESRNRQSPNKSVHLELTKIFHLKKITKAGHMEPGWSDHFCCHWFEAVHHLPWRSTWARETGCD